MLVVHQETRREIATLEEWRTVWKQIEQRCAREKAVIEKLVVNDTWELYDQFEEVLTEQWDEIQTVTVVTVPQDEWLAKVRREFREQIDRLIAWIDGELAAFDVMDRHGQFHSFVLPMFEYLAWMEEMLVYLLPQRVDTLRNQTKELARSLEEGDFVAIVDQAQFELVPLLEDIKQEVA